VFVSSHLLHEVELCCTHVAILNKGRLVRQSSVHDLLAGARSVEVRADDHERLRWAAVAYPNATGAKVEDDAVIVHLTDDDAAAFNRYLSGQGIYVSHLARRGLSLEEAFIGLTSDASPNEQAGVA
jgi:ABC-2 type transport system ATP-binding protein